jgi:hypothetical protein
MDFDDGPSHVFRFGQDGYELRVNYVGNSHWYPKTLQFRTSVNDTIHPLAIEAGRS